MHIHAHNRRLRMGWGPNGRRKAIGGGGANAKTLYAFNLYFMIKHVQISHTYAEMDAAVVT